MHSGRADEKSPALPENSFGSFDEFRGKFFSRNAAANTNASGQETDVEDWGKGKKIFPAEVSLNDNGATQISATVFSTGLVCAVSTDQM